MDARNEARSATPLGEFLWARRSTTQPEDVGLPRGRNRRVPGLRREEVAHLASISAEYYLRLEQGNDRDPSDQVLRGIARALRLDADAERHLARLRSLPQQARGSVGAASAELVPPTVADLLENFADAPMLVLSSNLDVLSTNKRAAATRGRQLSPGANLVDVAFPPDAEPTDVRYAEQLTAALRFHGNPYDRRFRELGAHLSARSALFARAWERHDARPIRDLRAPSGAVFEYSPAVLDAFEVAGDEPVLIALITASA